MIEQLENIKDFVKYQCLDTIETFSKEGDMTRDDFVSFTSQVAEIMFAIKSINNWTRLSYLSSVDFFAIIGFEDLDDLLEDYDEACKRGGF